MLNLNDGERLIDHGKQRAKDMATGEEFEAYVSEFRVQCGRCGMLHIGVNKVDAELANLNGNPAAFRMGEDEKFLTIIRDGKACS